MFFIVRGRARVVNYSVSGREITFADLAEGDYFGELSVIDGLPRSAGVMAVEDCLILSLPRRLFLAILADYPETALKVMQRLAKMVRNANERIMDLSTLAAHNRVQAELLRQAEPSNDPQRRGDPTHSGARRHRQPRLHDPRDGGARAQ